MGDQDAKIRKMFKSTKAKHGLNLKMGFKTNLFSFWRTKNVNEERRRGEGEEEEEEEKKKRRGEAKIKKVWIL